MKIQTYKKISLLAQIYCDSLDLEEVKKEFIKQGLLNQNSKLSKNPHLYGLSLTPSNLLSGFINNCGEEGACKLVCLFFSGIGNILKTNKILVNGELSAPIKKCIRRTFLFRKDENFFYSLLKIEIEKVEKLALLDNCKAKIRLNVFSDLDFRPFINSMEKNKNIVFYDYTKHWNRSNLKNYSLTFSDSEKKSWDQICEKLDSGSNVAMLFKEKILPKTYKGYPVLNGNDSEDRTLDKKGHIIGLTVKTTIRSGESYNKFSGK